MNAVLSVIETHRFRARDFIGGDAALDFINTVTGRDMTPRDWLDGYPRLLEWAGHAALLSKRTLRLLALKAERDSGAAAKALTRAKALREAMFALACAMARGRAPPKASLALLRQHWLKAAETHDLVFDDRRLVAKLDPDADDLDLVAAMVAWRLVEQVLPLPVERLRICEGSNCSWIFIDRSKAGRRRWCDMAVCGNAAKSRRFYART